MMGFISRLKRKAAGWLFVAVILNILILPVPVFAAGTPISIGEWADCEPLMNAVKSICGTDIENVTYERIAKISSLSVTGKQLEFVPGILSQFTGLTSLNLSNNSLYELPSLALMTNLQTLDISNNSFEQLPDLSGLESLKTLNVSRNYLTDMANYSELLNLKNVNFSNNFFTSLPTWLINPTITKNYQNNLLPGTRQRSLNYTGDSFYFVVGDLFDVELVTERVVDATILSDKTEIVDILELEVDHGVSAYITEDVIAKPALVTGKVYVKGSDLTNENAQAEFTIYLLDSTNIDTSKLELQNLVNKVSAFKKVDYTASSWGDIESKLSVAKSLLTMNNPDPDIIALSVRQLTAAVEVLVPAVDSASKKVLTDIVASYSKYNAADYTDDSWKPFAEALAEGNEVKASSDLSQERCEEIIKKIMERFEKLEKTKLSLPVVTTAELTEAAGKDQSINASGVMRNGDTYTWTFLGTDITNTSATNLEIIYDPTNESKYKTDLDADNMLIIKTVATDIPGKATLKADVSDVFKSGELDVFVIESGKYTPTAVSIVPEEGMLTFTVPGAGEYIIIPAMSSSEGITSAVYTIDGTDILGIEPKTTVATVMSNISGGGILTVYDANDTEKNPNDIIVTGYYLETMTGQFYTLIVSGDVNCDGAVTTADVTLVLKYLLEFDDIDLEFEQFSAADLDYDMEITSKDATLLLKKLIV